MIVPTNELGVIVRFVQECPDAIISIRSEFPDAIVRDLATGAELRAEFEYQASNFRTHKHDPRGCDIIICWENDLSDTVIPVIALSEKWRMIGADELPSDIEKEAEYWRIRAQASERKAAILRDEIRSAENTILDGHRWSYPTREEFNELLLDHPEISTRGMREVLVKNGFYPPPDSTIRSWFDASE